MQRERAAIMKSLSGKGFEVEQGGRDHDFLFFRHANLTRAIFVKVSRGTEYREIGDPLLAKMSKQLRLTRPQFDSLVGCSMNKPEYLAVLGSLGILRVPPA